MIHLLSNMTFSYLRRRSLHNHPLRHLVDPPLQSPPLHLLPLLLQRPEIPLHRPPVKLLPRHPLILALPTLDHRITTRLVEERNTVPLPPPIALLFRILDPMERALEPIIAPGHEQISDITDDIPRAQIDLRPGIADPEIRDGVPAGTDLQAGLARFLEQERQEVPVGVGAGSVLWSWGVLVGFVFVDAEVVQ